MNVRKFLIMKIKFYVSIIALLTFIGSAEAFGQNNFRSVGDGDWATSTIWEEETSPGVWENTSNIPDSTAGEILIQGFTFVGVSSQITADQIFIMEDGSLEINRNGHLLLNNGSGTDLEIEVFFFGGVFNVKAGGTLENKGTVIAPDGTAFFSSSGSYIHNQNGGNIIIANWDPQSNCSITGVTNIMPGQVSQNFGNFIWNCAGQSGNLSFAGKLQNVAGNLELLNSNGRSIILSSSESPTINVTKDFNVANNTRPALTNTGNATLNIGGNLNYSSSNIFVLTGSGSGVIDVNGALNATAGTIRFVQSTSGTPVARINLAGNLSLSGTTLSTASNAGATAAVILDGSRLQTYSNSSSTISGEIDFTLKNSSLVDFGTSVLSGSGNFTLESLSTLYLKSTDINGAVLNQVAVTGSKTYGTDATIVLNNSGGIKQYLGAGFPRGSDVNLEINNSGGVDLADDFTIDANAELILTNGSFNVQSNTIRFIGGIRAGGLGSLDFVSTSNLRISKDGDFGALPLSGFEELNKVTLDGANTTASLTSSLSVDSLVFANSSSLAVGSNTLSISEYYEGENATNGGGGLNASTGSILEIGPDTNNDNPALGNLTFIGGNTLSKLVLNRPGGSVSIPSTLNVADTLKMLNGTLNNASGSLKLANGATIIKQGGTSFGNAPSTSGTLSSYNVIYKGTLNTGKELNNVAAANIKNLTTDAGSVVTLNTDITQPLTINGYFLNNGSFNTNGKSLDIKGNITNNAALNPGNSSFLFSGTTLVDGSSNLSLSNVEITGSLTAPTSTVLEIQGNWFVNGGTFNPNGGTVEFSGSSLQSITSAAQPFFNVNITGSGGISLTDAMDADGSYTLASTSSFTHGTNPVNIGGNVILQGTLNQGEGIFTLDGSSSQSITSNGKAFRNLTFGGSGTKTIQDSLSVSRNLVINSILSTTNFNRSIAVGGNWENNSSFVGNSGTVYFNGSSTQQILGTAVTEFNNMTVSNIAGPPGLRVNSHTNLSGVLTLAANVSMDTDGGASDGDGGIDFTLISSATKTAAVAALPSGAVINGNVVVQRHIPAANVWRYIATPVQGATVANWADDFSLSQNTVYIYDETNTAAGAVGYVSYGTTSNPLDVGRGYAVKMPSTAQDIMANIRGPLKQGQVDFNTTYTNTGVENEDGWNLLGNPYPSTIDVESAGWTWTNVNPTVSIADNTSSADGLQYTTYNRETNVGINGGSRYIASGQAFWIQTLGATHSLVATEPVKAGSETGTRFFRTSPPQDYLIVAVNQGNKRDETAVFFRDDATEAYDNTLDSYKRQNEIFNLSTLTSDNIDVSFDLRPWFECATSIPLNITNIQDGAYTLDFRQLNSFTKVVDIVLIDKFNNTSTAVTEGFEYEFNVTPEAASKGNERFLLQFSTEAPLTTLSVEGSSICENEAEATISIANTQEGVSYQVFKGEQAVNEKLSGNGSALTMAVTASLLNAGSNELRVVASKGNCSSLNLEQTAQVVKNILSEVTETLGASNCGSASLNLQASGAPEGASYRWYTSAETTTPIEETTETSFTTPVLFESTTYWVSIMNNAGCESTERVAVTAEINSLSKPEIQQEEGTLTSSYTKGNQWLLNGKAIEGAVEQSFMPTTSGAYSVQVQLGECQAVSEAFEFTVAGIEEDLAAIGIQVFPNPAQQKLRISYGIKEAKEVNYSVYSLNGSKVAYGIITERNSEGKLNQSLDVSGYSEGIYTILLNDGKKSYTLRFIKK
jgi:hypothetical protein